MNRLRSLLDRRVLGTRLLAGAGAALAACGCGRAARAQPAAPPGHAPGAHPGGPAAVGEARTLRSRALGAGAAVLQDKAPLDAMNLYLNGFHFYADDMGRPVEAHHFCTHLTEDLHQCTIFDANHAQARLIGIEYIVSERVFRDLPADEKPLWHSHAHETTSGMLAMPGIPAAVENVAMRDLSTTYGKTWHTWQVDRGDQLPLGIPQLMMGFTRDGQLDPALVAERDRNLGLDTAANRRARSGIPVPEVAPGADAWQNGESRQLSVGPVPLRNRR